MRPLNIRNVGPSEGYKATRCDGDRRSCEAVRREDGPSRSCVVVVASPDAPWHCAAPIFSYAVRLGHRIDNPVHGVVKFATSRRERRLTDDEFRRLRPALSKATQERVWKPAIAAAWQMVLTGWRRGEVVGLRWLEIDLPRRTARPEDTKTGASLRALSQAAGAVMLTFCGQTDRHSS